MASFIGTKKEFKRYIGPMLRNLVQQLTKKHKSKIGQCQHCGAPDSLEAAHLHGRDRGEIIDNILNNYTNNSIITIDLSEFEKHFREEHHVIDETIIILCRNCHSKYGTEPSSNNHRAFPADKLLQQPPHTIENNSNKPSGRSFTNSVIQQKISLIAKNLTYEELEQFCNKDNSKKSFDLDFPLFVQIPKDASIAEKNNALKDRHGRKRWTLKFEFEKNGYVFAITTQWYAKHDNKVKEWLSRHE
jgi:5-methylcytosine-specific restriction endonuclease McrA